MLDVGASVEKGSLIRVENQNRGLHENDTYVAVHCDSESGKEFCLLFTQLDIADCPKAARWPFRSAADCGRIYSLKIRPEGSTSL